MTKAISFAKLDFLTIKPYLTWKNLAIFTVVFGFIGYGTGNASMAVGMLMMYCTLYVSYPFAVGDKNGLDLLYNVLPITRLHVVVGRYLFVIGLNVMVGSASFAVSTALTLAMQKPFSAGETGFTVFVCFLLFTVLQAIQLPIFFKLGYTKAKLVSFLPLAAFPAFVMVTSSFLGDRWKMAVANLITWVQANSLLTWVLALVGWSLLFACSCLLSYQVYRKREF